MHKRNTIQLLTSYELDKAKWDNCIDSSPNSLIYAKSFYLDNMHANWCCLVAENYDWVLPITSKKKWGISYLFQPPFVQQLGIFSKTGIHIPVDEIISILQKQYKFWEINWHYATLVDKIAQPVEVMPATNFILNLATGYETIFNNYHNDLIKNLRKSRKNNLTYLCTSDYKKCINLYQKYYGQRIAHVQNQDYQNFKTLCEFALKNKELYCRQAVNEDGEILSIVLLLKDNKRLYNLMNTTTPLGRKAEANHFLLDAVISEFAGRELVLDFEGSDIPGVKIFYENFGGQNQPFFRLKYNELPWPVKMIKA